MATTYLSRTPSSASNRKTWTWSGWFKRAVKSDSNNSRIFAAGTGSTDYTSWYMYAAEGTDGTLQFQNRISGTTTSVALNKKFRDVNAWYHLVIAMDTTQANASDRMKIYINGVQETSFSTFNPPAQNVDTWVNNNNSHTIGSSETTGYSPRYWSGSMSHINFVDGTAYDATPFGSTDSITGEWRINTNPSVTYGTNGYFILKDGNSVTDQSPNTNNWTVAGGTLTKTEDNPSDVFCTFNPLIQIPSSSYANGNTKATDGANAHKAFYGTLGFITGKYYWEAKAVGGTKYTIGLSDVENYINYNQVALTNVIIGESSNSYGSGDAIGWYYNTLNKNGSAVASSLHTIVTNDIMMIAADADNGKIYYGVNGTWRVANSTTFDAAQNDTTFTTGKFYAPAFSLEGCSWEANFGNGYFGTTAVSSAGTNASNIGIFEYDVPTGFTALSTKGLNE